MNFLRNLLILCLIFQNTLSDDPANSNKIVTLVQRTYYLNKLAVMEVTFAQSSELILSSLPEEGLKLVEMYMKEFMRANENLTGFNLTHDAGVNAEAVGFNPIATFHMVRRFREELLELKKYLFENNSPFSNLLASETWFGADDYLAAIQNINQITHVYNLRISEIADGVFEDIRTGTTLNARDCFDIGQIAPKLDFKAQGITFLEEALERVAVDGSMDKSVIELQLIYSLKLHDDSLKDSTPDELMYYFNRKIGPLRKRYPTQYKWMRTLNRLKSGSVTKEHDICKFGDLRDNKAKKDLFCWYERTTDLYFAINPLKMEVLSLTPELIQVYEIVGPKQMRFIRELSNNKSRLNRTNLRDSLRSETALLDETQHVELMSMPKTLEKLLGLNIVTHGATRNMRVITYTPGGYFGSHYDVYTFNRDAAPQLTSTTFLYYIEEPILGGATTFQRANLAVKPIEGSGIFFYNLRSDWVTERSSKHSGCPVILGRKRAAGKASYPLEQMLTIKCNPDRLKPYKLYPKSKIYQGKRNKLIK